MSCVTMDRSMSTTGRDSIEGSDAFRSTFGQTPSVAILKQQRRFQVLIQEFAEHLKTLFHFNLGAGLETTRVGITPTGFLGIYVEAPEVIGGFEPWMELPVRHESRQLLDPYHAVLRLMSPDTEISIGLEKLEKAAAEIVQREKDAIPESLKALDKEFRQCARENEGFIDKYDAADVLRNGNCDPILDLYWAFHGENLHKLTNEGLRWLYQFQHSDTLKEIEPCDACKHFLRESGYVEGEELSTSQRNLQSLAEQCQMEKKEYHVSVGHILEEVLFKVRSDGIGKVKELEMKLRESESKRLKGEAKLAKVAAFKDDMAITIREGKEEKTKRLKAEAEIEKVTASKNRLEVEVKERKEEKQATKLKHEAEVLSYTTTIDELKRSLKLAEKEVSDQKKAHETQISTIGKNFDKMKELGKKHKEEAKVASLNYAHSEEKATKLETKSQSAEEENAKLRRELELAREENKKLLSQRSNPRVEADLRQKAVREAIVQKDDELEAERRENERLRDMVQAQDERAREMYSERVELLTRLKSYESAN